MAKIHKVELYILDINDMYDSLDDIITDCERSVDDVIFKLELGQTVNVEWTDDINLNFINCPMDNYHKYFEKFTELK